MFYDLWGLICSFNFLRFRRDGFDWPSQEFFRGHDHTNPVEQIKGKRSFSCQLYEADNLQWKGYLVFMVLNFLFIPLWYFCYPETANLTLEEIDYIFSDESKGAVKWSLQMRREKLSGERKEGFVNVGDVERRRSSRANGQRDSEETKTGADHEEKIWWNDELDISRESRV